MRTAKAIIEDVYGSQKEAAARLGVRPSAPSNWVKHGHFSAKAANKIVEHAKEKGVALSVEEIPTLDRKRSLQ